MYVTYVILNQDGDVFEQSDIPISYIQGSPKGLYLKVEAALEGCGVGDKVEVDLSPEEGFGPHNPALSFTDDIDNVPPQFRRVGAQVDFQNEQGESKEFLVTKIENGKLTVDANHPLAGQTVKFIVTVTNVREADPEELYAGEPKDSIPPSLH